MRHRYLLKRKTRGEGTEATQWFCPNDRYCVLLTIRWCERVLRSRKRYGPPPCTAGNRHEECGLRRHNATENSYVLEHDCLMLLPAFEDKNFHLVLEITEREPLMLTPKGKAMFARLNSHGVHLALDDFGTGYSGLSYLTEIEVNYIKIDKSFVRRISSERDSTLLIDCVIELARKRSVNIIAEGVETQNQVNYLNTKAIRLLQGYYFWRPVPFSRLAPALMFGFHRIRC